MITTAVAAAHVLILVVSTDLGAALILFVVYLVMLYVATKQPLYAAAGLGAGSLAAVAGYHLFAHIKVRVAAWKDPFASYNEGGYQVAQSLFAIGTGSWFGMGLCQGSPDMIPVAESDLFCDCGRAGCDLCALPDPDLCELLCDVLEYCHGAAQSVL